MGSKEVQESKKAKHLQERDQWSSKLDFILSCVGYAIGTLNSILIIKNFLKKDNFNLIFRTWKCLEVKKFCKI